MKTRRFLALMLILVLCLSVLAGCGSKFIGKAKAKEIALADAGVTVQDIRDYDCELDREVIGQTAYEVSFDVGFDDYEYTIDALTGEILKFEKD